MAHRGRRSLRPPRAAGGTTSQRGEAQATKRRGPVGSCAVLEHLCVPIGYSVSISATQPAVGPAPGTPRPTLRSVTRQASLPLIEISFLISGRQEPQWVPARKRLPTSSAQCRHVAPRRRRIAQRRASAPRSPGVSKLTPMATQPFSGRTIAVPESREIEVFAALLERRGAHVIRCPLVAIRDAPDPAPVLEWSRR